MSAPQPSSVYREPAALDELAPPPMPRGLVRANGCRCTCTPPGFIWCWWYEVQVGDRWFCTHGGAWIRRVDRSIPFSPRHWALTE